MKTKTTKMTLTALKQHVARQNKKTAVANKLFDSLKPAEKRVYIARDVLAQLATKKLVAATGMWLDSGSSRKLFTDTDHDAAHRQVRDVLAKQKQCTGCALGAMFMCAVKTADSLKMEDLSADSYNEMGQGDVFQYMQRFFSQKQLQMIEAAFERGDGAISLVDADNDSLHFALDVESPTERMILIMQNIIVHKGKFVPQDQPIANTTYTTPGFKS